MSKIQGWCGDEDPHEEHDWTDRREIDHYCEGIKGKPVKVWSPPDAFGVQVKKDPNGGWRVFLPHQCEEWDIAGELGGGLSKVEAMAELDRFIFEIMAAKEYIIGEQEWNASAPPPPPQPTMKTLTAAHFYPREKLGTPEVMAALAEAAEAMAQELLDEGYVLPGDVSEVSFEHVGGFERPSENNDGTLRVQPEGGIYHITVVGRRP